MALASSPSPERPSPQSASRQGEASESLTAGALLRWRREVLAEGGHAPDFDWLLDLAGGLPWARLQALPLHPERPVRLRRGRSALESLWRRHRRTSEPLQYLVGLCPWRDLELQVGPGVLIPRQETELLVELALERASALRPSGACLRWADLGTGSGCLAIALAQALPAARGFAVERSPSALAQARRNLSRSQAAERVQLLEGDWWEPLRSWWGTLDLVVANPPYIPSATVAALDPVVREHEPLLALDGGHDGLEALGRIVAGAPGALAPGGMILLEHHHDQSAAVLALLAGAGLVEAMAHRDLEGNHRFAAACRPLAACGGPP